MRLRRGRREDGAVAVEFALVVPILLGVVFAIIVFGFLFAQDLALSNAARQGARFGAIPSHTCDAIKGQTKSAAEPLVTLADANIDVVLPAGGDCATEPCTSTAVDASITVNITYEADVVVPVPFMSNTHTLTAKGVFRCE